MTRYLDATLGRLREGGFSIEGALDAWNALDSHLYGFTLQELNLPFEVEESSAVSASVLPQIPADQFPHVVEVIGHVMAHGRREDFEFGLDLILDGLERQLAEGHEAWLLTLAKWLSTVATWNTTTNIQYIARPDGRVAFDVDGAGPLVVLVPGMGDLRSTYRHLAPTLRAAGYRVAVTDLRGHGDSDATFSVYGDEATAGDLIALVEHLGGPALLVGNSLGAGAAALVAALRPELVSGLVLVGPFVRDPELSLATRLMLRVAMARPWGARAWVSYLPKLNAGERPEDFDAHLACDPAQPVPAGIRARLLADHPPDDARTGRGAAGGRRAPRPW